MKTQTKTDGKTSKEYPEIDGCKKYGVIATDTSLCHMWDSKIVARDKLWLFDSFQKAQEFVYQLEENRYWTGIEIKLFTAILDMDKNKEVE